MRDDGFGASALGEVPESMPTMSSTTVVGVLVLKKKGVSASYRLFDGDREVALLRSDGSWMSGSLELAGRQLAFGVSNSEQTEFTATIDGTVVASGSYTALDAYQVDSEGSRLCMSKTGFGQKPFDVTDDAGAAIGVVALRGAMGRRIEIDLPDRVPEVVRLLCGWLATRSYNKAAQVRAVMP